jgi:hypothetical protein
MSVDTKIACAHYAATKKTNLNRQLQARSTSYTLTDYAYTTRNPAVRVIEVNIETPYPDRIRKSVKTALVTHVLFAAQSICNTQLLSEVRRDVVNAPPECAADALLQDKQDQRHSLAYVHRKH